MSFLSFDGDMVRLPSLDIYLGRGDKSLVDRAAKSALSSTGWLVKERLWGEAEKLPRLNPHSPVLTLAMARAASGKAGGWVHKYVGRGKKRKRLKHFERVGSANPDSRHGTGGGNDMPPFRKVRKSLRYRVHTKDNMVQIGFLNNGVLNWNLSQLVARQADEKTLPISDAMRRFFFAAGFPRRKGAVLRRPARPWFGQYLNRENDQIIEHFRSRFFGALERYATGAAKS